MKEAIQTIEITNVEPTYAWGECGGGGKETDGDHCGNTVKFDPKEMGYAPCAACGVLWVLADDDQTATATFDPQHYASEELRAWARGGKFKTRAGRIR